MGTLNNKLVDYQSLKENTKLILNEALAYDKGLTGGYNGDFPLTAATKDNIYRVPATNKFYVCIENYNGSNLTAPNANFVELSVWKNYDRLSNLVSFEEKNDWKIVKINKFIFLNKTVEFNCHPDSTKIEFPFKLKAFPNYNVLFGEITHSNEIEKSAKVWLDKTESTYFTAYSSSTHINELIIVSVFGFLP